MTIGKEIREARVRAKQSLRSFSEELGVSPALLSLIERSHHVPSTELIVRAAQLLDADANYWCGLAGTISPDAEEVFAELARKNPTYFRRLVNNWRASNG